MVLLNIYKTNSKMTDFDLKTWQQKSPELREAAPSFGKLKVEWRFSDSFLEDLYNFCG